MGVGKPGRYIADHLERQRAGAADARRLGEAPVGQVGGHHEAAVDPVGVPDGHDVAVRELTRDAGLVFDRVPTLPHAVGSRSRGRFLFIVPWEGRTLVGTDYQPAETTPGDPQAFLAEADRAFPWASLAGSRVVLVHEGLVPGRVGASGLATRPRLHDHEAEDDLPGLVSLQGVKYTTARAVAERAVDLVLRRLGRPAVSCRTAVTTLRGARPLEGPLESRTREAVRQEMALTLADAVLRRLDLGTAGRPPEADVDVVCRAMAGELGWDAERQQRERDALDRTYPRP